MRAKKQYPGWVEKFRKPGYEIKEINGSYYLYTYKTIYNKDTKKPKKVSDSYIGRITEDKGLIPKKNSVPAPLQLDMGAPLEYGASRLLDKLGKDILDTLREYFRDEMANAVFVIGKTGLTEPSPFKHLGMIYSNSYDSVEYPGLDFSASAMTALLKELGSNREGQLAFMKEFISGSEYIIFDGTDLVSYSGNAEQTYENYDHYGIRDPRVNLLYCFSLSPVKAPVYFRAADKDKTDITAIKNAIRECGCKNVVLIADNSFSSKTNYETMIENKISCIVPLKRNDKLIDYSQIAREGEAAYDGLFNCNGHTVFYKVMHDKHETAADDLVVTYLDASMKKLEIDTYSARLAEGQENYSYDDFVKKLPSMGTVTIRSNAYTDPVKLYETYKERDNIAEAIRACITEPDRTVSDLQDKTSYYGWLFLNHISLMLYYRVLSCIKAKGLASEYSPHDIMALMRRITLQKVNGRWMPETGADIQPDMLKEIFPKQVNEILTEHIT